MNVHPAAIAAAAFLGETRQAEPVLLPGAGGAQVQLLSEAGADRGDLFFPAPPLDSGDAEPAPEASTDEAGDGG